MTDLATPQKKLNLRVVPVNQSVIVKQIEREAWLKMTGEVPEGPQKVTEHLYAPEGAGLGTDVDDMVVYDQGQIVEINATDKLPFDLQIGDYVVFNHGATVHRGIMERVKMVKIVDIIVVFRDVDQEKLQSAKNPKSEKKNGK